MSIQTGMARKEGRADAEAALVAVIANKMGEVCGAARRDWVDAGPADVGLNGVVVKQWREGYFEGCKDMAEKIAAALPDGNLERCKQIAREAFEKAFNQKAAENAE